MPVGIVVGLVAETRIARRLGYPMAIGGGTAERAERASRNLLAAGADTLISFGLAGGLDPALHPGTLIVPSAVITRGQRYDTDRCVSARLGGATPQVIAGSDAVAASVEQKRRLHEQTGAAAVDLESGAVARVATDRGIPFAVLRAICDPAEFDLPPAALAALDALGAIGAWRVLTSVATRPRQLRALLSLAADAAKARRALRARIAEIADQSV